MTVSQNSFGYDVCCDRCSNSESVDAECWSDLMDWMKRNGWRSEKVEGDWEHVCPLHEEEDNDGGGMPNATW